MLPADQAKNYDQLKAALLKRYQLSDDGFKRRFRTAKPEPGETPTQFLTRIDNYLQRWIELAKAEKAFDGLKTLMDREQYLSVCPKEMAMHLKEGKPKTILELKPRTTQRLTPPTLSSALIQNPQTFKVCDLECDNVVFAIGSDTCNTSALTRHHPVEFEETQMLPAPTSRNPSNTDNHHNSRGQLDKLNSLELACGVTCGKVGHMAQNCFAKPNPTVAGKKRAHQKIAGRVPRTSDTTK